MKSSAFIWFITMTAVFVGLSCSPALAQGGKSGIKLPAVDAQGGLSGQRTEPTPGIKLPLPAFATNLTHPGQSVKGMLSGPYIKPPQFVVKGGAAYLALETPSKLIPIPIDASGKLIYIPTEITAWLVPLAGGGKSGCFGADSSGPAIKIVTQIDHNTGQK